MADGRPTNINSLQQRIRNHCTASGLDVGRVQRHLAVIVVAQMLGDIGAVVKGGRNLEIRYGMRSTRASSDLDVVRPQSVAAFVDALEETLGVGWEGFRGVVKDRGPIRAPVPEDYLPHRLEVKLTYGGRSGVGTVVLELAAEEADGLAETDVVDSRDAQGLFSAVGLPTPGPVTVLRLPVQIAQKLHACTTPDDLAAGWVNDRAHDLIDLQLLVGDLADEQLSEVRQAAERLFASRDRHRWPPDVIERDGWSQRYLTELETVDIADLLPDVGAALAWLDAFIQRVAKA